MNFDDKISALHSLKMIFLKLCQSGRAKIKNLYILQ